MKKTITLNPVTRISGFLEVTVEIEGNKIVNAKTAGLLFRGFEKMLQGRPPMDAIYFTERICGICSTAHSVVSALALENAFGIIPDSNERYLREILHGSEFLQNHLRHFYQYTIPDFVKGPVVSPVYSVTHKDFRLPDKLNKKLAEDYIESIQYSRMGHEITAILGGKAPHNHGVFAGGVTVNINADKIIKIKARLKSIKEFVENKMIEDAVILGQYYKDYFKNGGNTKNLMSYGLYNYPQMGILYVEPKVSVEGKLEALDPQSINESIYSSWYKGEKEENKPTDETVEEEIQKEGGYSFVKAPRYKGQAMEVGPLARMILSGNYAHRISTMDRTIARVMETKKIIEFMEQFLDLIVIKDCTDKNYKLPEEAVGYGMNDTTRGSLGHWIAVEDTAIKNYRIITPSAWNLSPRDGSGVAGPIENALIGTSIEDVKNPVEIGRIVRSFDPCVSCATHVLRSGEPLLQIRIV